MNTALEEMHHIPQHIRIGRARGGVLMLILSDSLSLVAILAAGGYLSSLNTENQYRLPTDNAPAFLPGLLLTIGLLLSGVTYYLWERRVRKNAGAVSMGQSIFYILSLLLMVAAMIGQIWISATLGYAAPFHAYVSLIILLSWFSAVHLALLVIIGLLLLGRIVRGRLADHAYIAEVTGYWWYYTVIGSAILWMFSVSIR